MKLWATVKEAVAAAEVEISQEEGTEARLCAAGLDAIDRARVAGSRDGRDVDRVRPAPAPGYWP